MDESIIQVPIYTSTSAWRMEAQLRGLLRNHPSVIANSGPLAAPGTVFSTAQLALDSSERMLALGLNPLGASGSVGFMPIEGSEPTLEGATNMRWLDMPADVCISGIDCCGEDVLVGSTRGRIFFVKAGLNALHEGSEVIKPSLRLTSGDTQAIVRDIIVSPGAHAASTMVRSIECNVDVKPSSVLAVLDSRCMVWDLDGAHEHPVYSWYPSTNTSLSGCHDVLMFAHWAPASSTVVFTGSYGGDLVFTDTRTDSNAAASLSLPTRRECAAKCADFNRLLPFVVAVALSDGTISLFDCRFPSSAVRTIPSLQGGVASLKWFRLHSDIFATGGVDGTVALWNLRSPPTYCVGRAQYKCPVVSLATTSFSTEERVFGLTTGGELTLTGLTRPAIEALGLSVTDKIDSSDVNEDVLQLREREKQGAGLLYARRLREAYKIIAACAVERFARKDTTMSLSLLATTNVMAIPSFDYKDMIRDKVMCDLGQTGTTPVGLSMAVQSPSSQAHAFYQFNDIIARSSEKLCMTLPFGKIRDLEKPTSEDFRKLEALQFNLLLQHISHSGDVGDVINSLQLFAANAGNLELLDSETVCGIATMLLKENHTKGERFVRTFLSLLIRHDGIIIARPLTRCLLIVVQEPLITAGLPFQQAKRYEERFLRNMLLAQKAVEVQLTIQGLGIERYQEVIAAVNSYQKRCLENGESGIFGWLAIKPILLFLQSLKADSNYATFFWACVQLIDAFAKCPGAREVESLLFRTVDSIRNAAHRIEEQLQRSAGTVSFSPLTLREAGKTLRTAINFLVVILRVQLECENVAIESGMNELPTIMTCIFDILSTSSSDLLEAWAALLDKLVDCTLRDLVRRCCVGLIRKFSSRIKDLMLLSVKKKEDETLSEILDTCYNFLDNFI